MMIKMEEIDMLSIADVRKLLKKYVEKENKRREKMKASMKKYRMSEKGREKMKEIQRNYYKKCKKTVENTKKSEILAKS